MRKILPALSIAIVMGIGIGCSKDEGGNNADPPLKIGAKSVVMNVPAMS